MNQGISCGILTVSDTRQPDSDRSGQAIREQLLAAGHTVEWSALVKDDRHQILAALHEALQLPQLRAILVTGGTGIAPRDCTYEAIAPLLEKEIPGFGELFRWLSYQEIGSRAMASRATAGTYQQRLVFLLPGSTAAVGLALARLILPELPHLCRLMAGQGH